MANQKMSVRSPHIANVESILTAMAINRKNDRGWFDSEAENPELETMVFKIAESIYAFLLADKNEIGMFLEEDLLLEDINFVFETIKNDGFYPSPYSQIPAVDDSYTDFAAFILDFSSLVLSRFSKNQPLVKNAKAIANKALDFLLTPAHYILDKDGCRWAGTKLLKRKKKVEEYYSDVYFTSRIIISLANYIDNQTNFIKEEKKQHIINLIKSAGTWILGRSQNSIISGNENKSYFQFIYFTWGLRAIVETYNYQNEHIKNQLNPHVTKYINMVEDKLEKSGVSLVQEYMTVLSPSTENPLYYEDRSDWAGIFLTLISFKKISSLEDILDKLKYGTILDSVYEGLLTLKDNNTKLWYKDKLLLSAHAYLVESFIMFDKLMKDFVVKLNVTSALVRKAVKETISDDSVISFLQQEIYRNLQRIYKKEHSASIIDKEVNS